MGEILALSHNDIDLENKTINVDKSLNHTKVDGKLKVVITRPKTTESIRLIPIIDNLVAPLEDHIAAEVEKHSRLGIPFSKKTSCSPLRNVHRYALIIYGTDGRSTRIEPEYHT